MKRFLLTAALATVACAVLAVSCKKDDPIPVVTITAQPTAPAAQTEGAITGTLTVTASVTENAKLTYQWYSNTAANNTGGTVISGATGASYTLPTTLAAGTYYYFCEIGAEGAKAVRTSAVTVTVAAKPAPPAPVITIGTQPTTPSGTLTEGSIPADTKLTVAATATQGATLAYQWYTYDPAQQGDAAFTKIDGATAASYTLPTTLAAGEHWYVCEISAEGAESKQTDPVKVTVAAKPVVVPPLVIDPAANYAIPAMTVGTAISALDVSGAVSGGTAPYTYAATGLPAGLTIAPATGIISGTPTAAKEAGTATVTVTDSSTPAKTATISVKYAAVTPAVTPPPPPPADTTAPTVSSITPANNATGVPRAGNIVITFSEAMNSAVGTVRLQKAATTATTTLTGGSWNTPANTVFTVPYSGLDWETSYDVWVRDDFADAAGNTLSTSGYRFTTETDPSQTVIAARAITGTGVAAPVAGAEIPSGDAARITATDQYTGLVHWYEYENGGPVGGSLNGNGRTFEAGKQYLATVTMERKSSAYTFTGTDEDAWTVAGATYTNTGYNNGASLRLSFVFPATTPTDTTAPTVTAVSTDGATSAPVSGTISVTFSEPMDKSAVGTIQLFDALHPENTVTTTGGVWNTAGTVYTVTYGGLAYATEYQITGFPNNFADLAGNPYIQIGVDDRFKFTTEAAPVTQPTIVAAHAITSVAVPVGGAVNTSVAPSGTGYAAALIWSPLTFDDGGKFKYETTYTAIVSMEAADGYTFTGTNAAGFTIAGATNGGVPTVSIHTAKQLILQYKFPATAADNTKPTVVSVTPTGTGAATEGDLVITFSEPMKTDNGAVTLNGVIYGSHLGSWSEGNTVFTVEYSGLAYSTAYTVKIESFANAAGNTMLTNTAYSFTTVAATGIITITTEPQDLALTQGAIPDGTKLTVAASASNGAMLSYQWYQVMDGNELQLHGRTEPTLPISTITTAGTYRYYCVVSMSGAESKTTRTATVTVSAPATGGDNITIGGGTTGGDWTR